eukprot:3979371-Amphidinium_carterae.2
MRATKAPLGFTQARRGPRSKTASWTCTGSLRSSLAAAGSMLLMWRNSSTSSLADSLMMRTSSAERMESSEPGAPNHKLRASCATDDGAWLMCDTHALCCNAANEDQGQHLTCPMKA